MHIRHPIYIQFLSIIFLLQGCTHHIVTNPNRYTIGLDRVPKIVSNGTIQLINNQPDSNDKLLAKQGVHKFMGNYHQMTDTALQIGLQALHNHGITPSEDAEKSLKLSVIGTERIPATWIFRFVVKLEVEKGDGEKIIFKGDNSTGGSLYRGIDGAILKSVITMFNDPNIQVYLESEDPEPVDSLNDINNYYSPGE